ncbi:MAG: YeeE/YedE family protein [Candidatus Accumulibacter sp.]|uniref:YeeE/YedE family protein n=1 Tax=Accumulibacter sp. TaxID=2053492 RepID=UPI00258C0C60|nr:YeeE/YedE family protein [Accumulibacter sp.]MCM8622321.1 YeeE/YedE family protein [Accumulibacter sp.]
MTIDWLHFTPASALAGGLLIGLAAALLILLEGRIAGISGIVGGLLQPLRKGDVAWRAAFALGLVAAPLLYQALAELPQSRIDTGWATLIVAGALVGFGSRLGSGCTSGHGVCGLSRRSPRSLVATLVFMSAGFATVFASRHLFA